MGLKDRSFAWLADQLSGPHGVFGRLLARRLNKFNLIGITAAVDHLDPEVGATVADLGYGGGLGLELLLERAGPTGRVYGIEPAADMVTRARRRWSGAIADGHLALLEATADDLDLEDDSLDGLITCNTIYFWPDLAIGLVELARVLRPGGAVVIGMADPEHLRSRPFAEHGFTIYEADTVAAALQTAGFAEPEVKSVDIGRGPFHLLRAEVPD